MKRRLHYYHLETKRRKSQGRNYKGKVIITKYPDVQHRFIFCANYSGRKLLCDKIGFLRKNWKRNRKHGWEIKLERQVKKLLQQARMQWKKKKKRHANICCNEKKSKQNSTQSGNASKEINQKTLTKEERFKRYRDSLKYCTTALHRCR